MTDFPDRLQAALAGRYQLELDAAGSPRVLGRGGMATVYLAQDLKHRRPVALKVLHPDLAQALGPDRFLREIEIASQLNHPHILPLYDSGGADGLLYYVMPYVAGESLRQRLTRERQLPVDVAIRLAGEIGRALDYAHQQGVIHRDIKPENILLQDQAALVADFGISRAISGSLKQGAAQKLTETGLTLGTPAYMSPEQASGDKLLDGRSDLYSLGCVVYEMLVGEPPFSGPSGQAILARHVLDPVPPLRTVRSAVPEHTERAVRRALGKVPADRFENAEDFAKALLTPGPLPVFQPTEVHKTPARLAHPGRAVAVGLGVVLPLAAAAGILVSRRTAPRPLNPNLVAVAPFDVLDPKFQLWREGLVDYLTRNLDGAGQLRSVAPTVVLQRWKGPGGTGSAQALARRIGARIVVFGNLSPAGRDSVQVRATVLDALTGTSAAEYEGRDELDRVDRLADSLTLQVLRGLGRITSKGQVRLTSIGTRSIPALKEYLTGEQYFRRGGYDSAATSYRRAIAFDSTFALALHGLAEARGWGGTGGDEGDLQVRAARFNRGLSPTDSILILADSFRYAGSWSDLDRALTLLDEAGPGDPRLLLASGDIRYHRGFTADGWVHIRQLFDGAIDMDSTFAPAYPHAIELAGNPERAKPYIHGYFRALAPDGQSAGAGSKASARGIGLLALLIDASPKKAGRILDSVPVEELGRVIELAGTWHDSAEIAVQAERARVRRDRSDLVGEPKSRLARRLAYRGHLREARTTLGNRFGVTFLDLAMMDAIPADTVAVVGAEWFRKPDFVNPGEPLPHTTDPLDKFDTPRSAVLWWASRRDTSSLLATRRLQRVAPENPFAMPGYPGVSEDSLVTLAVLTLARADTTEALRRLLALPDSILGDDWRIRLLRFRLLAATGRDLEAAMVFDDQVSPTVSPVWALGMLERGRLAERMAAPNKAAECYQFVQEVWRNADPELQRYVAEARQGYERARRDVRRQAPE